MVRRTINILKNHSFLLFGARGTGKTSYIKEAFSGERCLYIDLLDPIENETLGADPRELVHRIDAKSDSLEWVLIDEVQKLPKLLDLVHKLIEERGIKFGLTGSSARKLKRGSANLLAGRAFTYSLFPLTATELGGEFDLLAALEWGTLPSVAFLPTAEERKLYLQTYVHTYLREEIQVEQVVRNLDPFRRFLQVAAQMNTKILNYSRISADVGVSDRTVQSYFQILEDTLLGTLLEPYHTSVRRRLAQSPKFYFFDTGVQRALERVLSIPLAQHTYAYGCAFETFVINEIIRRAAYQRNDFAFSYLRTKDGVEIDLIVERPGMPLALIEIKSTERVLDADVRPLSKLAADFSNAQSFCLSTDPHPKRIDKVLCLHWTDGVEEILGTIPSAKEN